MNNYREQAIVNMGSFCSETKFEDRKAFLLKIADEFNHQGVHWCLTCSSTMFFRGITTDFHDFDILIDWQDISKALAIVKKINAVDLTKGDQSLFASTLFNKYKYGNVYFDLFSEWRIKNMFHFTYVWQMDFIDEFDIEGVSIKMVKAKVQLVLYAVFSPWYKRRLDQTIAMAEYIRSMDENPN